MGEKNQLKVNPTLLNISYIVFSLICSLLIWVYVTESIGGETDRTFPGVMVVYEGESDMRDSRGLIISVRDTTSGKVTLGGNRRTLSTLDSADLKLIINLNDITGTGYYSLAPKVEYPRRVDTSTITQATVSPEVVSFYVDKLSVRPVPVTGVFNGSAAEGYSADPLEFDTETIRIYGPEQIISQVDHAQVEVNRTDVDKTLNFEASYTLIDSEGNKFESDEITFDRETVNVTLPISAVKVVNLTVDLVPGAGATRDNAKWSISPETITLTGDAATLEGINSISIAQIDLAKVDEALTESFKIVLPNDTESTDGIKEATLTLELQGMAKKTVTIDQSNISCTNVSQGYEAVVMNGSIENVVIRGPENVLRGITDNNIRAVADLTDYGTATGILSVPVRIIINGTTEAGALGEYKVYINVTKAPVVRTEE